MNFSYVYVLIHLATSKTSKWCFDNSSSWSVFFPLAVMMAITVVPWKLNVKLISVVPDMLWTSNKKKADSHHL